MKIQDRRPLPRLGKLDGAIRNGDRTVLQHRVLAFRVLAFRHRLLEQAAGTPHTELARRDYGRFDAAMSIVSQTSSRNDGYLSQVWPISIVRTAL
jgi:hypothetical protein